MKTIAELLAPIKERLENATPGPLVVDEHHGRFNLTNGKWGRYGEVDERLFYAEDMSEGDATLFANAPTDIAKLIKAVECLSEELRKIDKPSGIIPQRHWSADLAREALTQAEEILK